ncbi:hypothetical protein Droror1_Dr00005723 [Drosera rotundifolia]
MLLLQNCLEFVFAFLGASHIGAISMTANPLCTPAEIVKQARASKAKVILTQAGFVKKVKEYGDENGVKVVVVEGPVPEGCIHFSVLAQADENSSPDVEIALDDVVVLPYSSGTTGLPNGICTFFFWFNVLHMQMYIVKWNLV